MRMNGALSLCFFAILLLPSVSAAQVGVSYPQRNGIVTMCTHADGTVAVTEHSDLVAGDPDCPFPNADSSERPSELLRPAGANSYLDENGDAAARLRETGASTNNAEDKPMAPSVGTGQGTRCPVSAIAVSPQDDIAAELCPQTVDDASNATIDAIIKAANSTGAP